MQYAIAVGAKKSCIFSTRFCIVGPNERTLSLSRIALGSLPKSMKARSWDHLDGMASCVRIRYEVRAEYRRRCMPASW